MAFYASENKANEDRLRSKSLPPSKPPSINKQNIDDWEAKLYGKHLDGRRTTLERIDEKETNGEVEEKKRERRLSKFLHFRKVKEDIKHEHGHENQANGQRVEVPQEILDKYQGKSREVRYPMP